MYALVVLPLLILLLWGGFFILFSQLMPFSLVQGAWQPSMWNIICKKSDPRKVKVIDYLA